MVNVPALLRRSRARLGVGEPGAYAAVLTATLLWGIAGPLTKLLLGEAGFFSIGMMRAASTAIALAVLLYWRKGLRGFTMARGDFMRLVALTVVGWVLCQVVWLFALSRIPASVTIILGNTSPLFVALMAVLWLREPLKPRGVIGLVVSFAGVLLVVLGSAGDTSGPMDYLGIGAALLSGAAWGGYTVGCRAFTARYEPLRVTALAGLIAGACWMPLGLLEPPATRVASLDVLAGVVFLGVVPGAFAFTLFSMALGRMRAAQVGAFQYLVPLWAVLIAAVWLGETLTLPLIAGMLLVFVGLRLTQQR